MPDNKLVMNYMDDGAVASTFLSLLCVTLILSLPFTPSVAGAQEAQALEEVVVTAQRREQSIQDVGIAVTAYSGADVRSLGIINSTEIAYQTPGVYISGDGGGNQQQFTIRGSTQSDFSILAEGPNALYVDDAYQVTQLGQMFATYDIDRVEILKGPQGTLFGRNATGGLIHFITNRPSEEFEGYVDLAYGSYDSARIEGAISGPIGNKLSGRLSAFHFSQNPIYRNTFTTADLPETPQFLVDQGRGPLTVNPNDQQDVFQAEQWALRGQLLWEPTAESSLLLQAHYAYSDPGAPPYQQRATVAIVDDTSGNGIEEEVIDTAFAENVLTADRACDQISANSGECVNSVFDLTFSGLRAQPDGDFWGYSPPDGVGGRRVKISHASDDSNEREIFGINAHYAHTFENISFSSVTSWSEQSKRQSLDVDSGPAPQFIVMDEMEFDWFTQEFRIAGDTDRTRWTVGLYYLTADGRFSQGLADQIGGINVFGGLFFNGVLPDAGPSSFLEATFDARLQTDSYSAFGHVDYDLTDTLELTLGLRAIQEEKSYGYNNRLYQNTRDNRVDSAQFGDAEPLRLPEGFGGGILEFLPPHQERTSDFLWSARTSLQWRPSEDLMLYGGVNRGVKAGSFNSPLLTTLSPDEYGYDEEVLMAYEVGFKSSLLGGRMRLNGAAYYYDYNDYQAFQFIGTSGAVFNVDATYQGFEVDVMSRFTDNLDVGFGFAYIDATVKDLLVAPNVVRDVEPTYTPGTQFSFLVKQAWPDLIMNGELMLQLDGSYVASAFTSLNNFGTHKMDAYWLSNARLSWLDASGRLEISVFVKNLVDETYQMQGFELSTICGCDEAAYGAPRMFGIQARFTF